MANMCMLDPLKRSYPNCKGVCRAGEKICSFYYIDPVYGVMIDWKKEAGVDTPVVWKHDYKRNKICLYTTKPGYFIGLNGTRYQKFHELLKKAAPNDELIRNGIDIIECEDGV